MKRRLKRLAFFSVMVFVLLGCVGGAYTHGEKEPTEAQTQKQVVVDLAGREVRLPVSVQRVVAIGPGALRLVTYVDGVKRVVGVEQFEKRPSLGRSYIMAFPELKALPEIGQGGPDIAPNAERLLSVHPDVIFACTVTDREEISQLQRKTGIPVIVLSYSKGGAAFDDNLYRSLNLLGTVLGKEQRARDIVEFFKENERDLANRTRDIQEEEKAAVYVGAVSMKGAHGIESTQANYPPFVFIGAKNIVDETKRNGSFMLDKEKLIRWNPDVIFLDAGGLSLVKEDYRKNPEVYEALDAVKNGRVYNQIPFNSYFTNIDTAFADAYFAGKIIYPEKFRDIEPTQKCDEIYRFLFGKDLYEKMARELNGFVKLDLRR